MNIAVWALIAVNVLYGINYAVAKTIMPEPILPSGIIFLRSAGALLLFWLSSFFLNSKTKIEKKDWIRLFLCGLFGVMLNQTLFFEGLSRSSPVEAALVMTINPVLVLLISAMLGYEHMKKMKWLGIVLSGGGAAALILQRQEGLIFSESHGFGNLLVLLNAASYAVFLVLVKPLMRKYPPLLVITWVFTFGMPLTAILGIPNLAPSQPALWSASVWWALAFVIIGVTFLAYLLNVYALKQVNASVVSAFIYLQPLVAGMIQLIFADFYFSWTLFLGSISIFLGLYLVVYSPKVKGL